MPKRVRDAPPSKKGKSEPKDEPSLPRESEIAAAALFNKYARPQTSMSSSGLPVVPARVVSGPVALAYEADAAVAARVAAFASPGSGAPPGTPISPGRRAPTHSSPTRSPALPSMPPPPESSDAPRAGSSAAVPHPRWREHLDGIIAMRSRRDAPVDSMGCERCADPAAPPAVQRFQTLVSLMLSSQTKDEVTHAAVQRLIAHGCTPEQIAATPLPKLEELIYPVGFYRNKAKFVAAAAQRCVSEFAGDIPRTLPDLLSLSGVGPKMAHIAMAAAWQDPTGIGVDTHVHRIANRLRWVRTEGGGSSKGGSGKGGSGPEATRAALESWLPRELWAGLNPLLVGFGQQVCQPANPRCEDCSIAHLCPVGAKTAAAAARSRTAAGAAAAGAKEE